MEYPCSGSEISILKPELKKYTIDSATKRHEQTLVWPRGKSHDQQEHNK